MGSTLQSKCSCGFESDELFVGGGMGDMGEICHVPYYCENCGIVGTINIKNKYSNDSSERVVKKDIKCKKCRRKVKYYGKVKGNSLECQEEYVFDWWINDEKRYYLQNGLHYCPKCKKDKMEFIMTGLLWD